MLVPGFTVTELPIRLSNVNNLRFSPNGILTALGYDGRIHLLRDTNGDGLEDSDELFWDRPTLRVPVGIAWTPQGLYVSSHGKVSLLRDMDGDGKADLEEVIASDWPPTDADSGGVDATAVTVDLEGNIYFGLLVADYANAYRLKDGAAHYDIKSRRGTIQKWSPKTKQLETIATGIRVPYTLAFNRRGDLFLTDQEGETWMPNGNPVDELNQIISGRNYGFPPPHPKYLPNLISEPPVVGFGPQHQSTCGLVFNERLESDSPAVRRGLGPACETFGPAWWEGDAFVTGESRGKLWRVRLVKTPAGYVGKQTLIATLRMLTTDVAISPKGDLYVSCHSGLPDWGTGPQGEGKLFKISYRNSAAPQPVIAWSQSPFEVRIAFDRPVDDKILRDLKGQEIEFGEFVRAGDRFEVLKPPYQVVKFQESVPHGKLKITGAALLHDRSVLSLSTDPHSQPVTYALSLPGVAAPGKGSAAAVDLAFDLNGLQGSWRSEEKNGSAGWDGWLPHFDFDVNRAFTSNSASHRALAPLLKQRGTLRLQSQIALPRGATTLVLETDGPFSATLGERNYRAVKRNGHQALEISFESDGTLRPFSVEIQTGPDTKVMTRGHFFTASDPTIRPLPLSSFLVPWASNYTPLRMPEGKGPEFAGADWQRGKALFTGERLKCSTCHRIRGEGASIGPDLSNLTHRDAASVLRDIREPNLTINPDFVAYQVTMADGENLNGFVRAQNEGTLRVLLPDGKERVLDRKAVEKFAASSISLMPSGLLDGLAEDEIRDLLFFLLNLPPESKAEKAPVRSRAELARILSVPEKDPPARSTRELRLTLVASRQDHPVGEHDYPQWQYSWMKLWQRAENVRVSKAWLWPDADQFSKSDVMIFYCWNHSWSPEQLTQLDGYLQRGGGVVLLHSACIADQNPEILAERTGLAAQPVKTKYRHGPIDLKFTALPNHPITRGFSQVHFLDESYWPMIGDAGKVQALATAVEEGKPWPMLWTFEKGKGRVFGSVLGHFNWTQEDPFFQLLALRAVAWAAGEPSNRFESLLPALP